MAVARSCLPLLGHLPVADTRYCPSQLSDADESCPGEHTCGGWSSAPVTVSQFTVAGRFCYPPLPVFKNSCGECPILPVIHWGSSISHFPVVRPGCGRDDEATPTGQAAGAHIPGRIRMELESSTAHWIEDLVANNHYGSGALHLKEGLERYRILENSKMSSRSIKPFI